MIVSVISTWKDKILDYEIETRGSFALRHRQWLLAWKDKILDYEIETLKSLGIIIG